MMTEKEKILSIIAKIFFKNGKNLKEVSSDIIIKGQNIGFSIDIDNLELEEVEKIKEIAIFNLKQELQLDNISIVTTRAYINPEKNTKGNSKQKHIIEGAKKIILVSSCKGGVGKSTIAAILAENLTALNFKIGILDADIYGPSIPTIFNCADKPEIINGKMIPNMVRGIEINSIGFLNNTDSALAWRGPMVSKAIYQLMSLTLWGNLDFLIIDMPPGTGDISLAIVENYHVDGVVIITTPQKLAQKDVEKSIDLYNKFNIPIFGIIENMSYFLHENIKYPLYPMPATTSLTEKYNLELLGQIGFIPEIAIRCDLGESVKNLVTIPLNFLIS